MISKGEWLIYWLILSLVHAAAFSLNLKNAIQGTAIVVSIVFAVLSGLCLIWSAIQVIVITWNDYKSRGL